MRTPRPILVLWYLPPMAVVLIIGSVIGFVADIAAAIEDQLRITWEHLDQQFTRRWRR